MPILEQNSSQQLIIGTQARIKETAGPTELSIGAIGDGEVLFRSGTSIKGDADLFFNDTVNKLTITGAGADTWTAQIIVSDSNAGGIAFFDTHSSFSNPFTVSGVDGFAGDGLNADCYGFLTGWSSVGGGGLAVVGISNSAGVPAFEFAAGLGNESSSIGAILFNAGTDDGAGSFTSLAASTLAFRFANNSTALIDIYGSGETTVTQWFQVGTATDSATQGDAVFGLTGAARFFYDQSLGTAFLYNSSGTQTLWLEGSSGSIGIGVDPDIPLDVLVNAASAQQLADFTNSNSGGSAAFRLVADGGASINMSFRSAGSTVAGNFGGQTAANQQTLYSNGSILNIGTADAFSFYIMTNFATRLVISSAGGWSQTGTGEVAFNDGQADCDFRIEGDSISHLFFTDATATTENIAVFAAAAPNWQSMDRGFFVGDTSAAPSGNPSSGGFLYSESGALKWRGSSGTVTVLAPA